MAMLVYGQVLPFVIELRGEPRFDKPIKTLKNDWRFFCLGVIITFYVVTKTLNLSKMSNVQRCFQYCLS